MIAFGPPALPGYGNVAGFTLQLQDRSGGSVDNLAAQVQRFIAEASKRPEIGRLTTTFQPATPQVNITLDREKARAVGVKVDSVFQTLQAYLSGLYVNDFVRFGRVFKVFLQAEPEFTHQPDQIVDHERHHDEHQQRLQQAAQNEPGHAGSARLCVLDQRRASFETVASRPPQDDNNLQCHQRYPSC